MALNKDVQATEIFGAGVDGKGILPDFKAPTTQSVNDQRYYAAQNQLKSRTESRVWNSRGDNYPFSIVDLKNKISGVSQLSKFYFDIPKLRNESVDRSKLVKKAWEKSIKDRPGAKEIIKNIYFYSENITIPMRGINTDPHVYANGFKFEAPIGTNYGDGDIAVTMIVDKNYYLYDFFMNWMNEIHSKDTGYFSFHDQYVTDIDIYQLNNININFPRNSNFDDMIANASSTGIINYKVSLGNCYLKSVTAIEFKHEAANERTKITVGFTYEKIDYVNPNQTTPTNVNISQLEDRYNFGNVVMAPPQPAQAVPNSPGGMVTPEIPVVTIDDIGPPSLGQPIIASNNAYMTAGNITGAGMVIPPNPVYNTTDYYQQSSTTTPNTGGRLVGPGEIFDPYTDNYIPPPTPEQFQAVRRQNIAQTLKAEIENVYQQNKAHNPPQWTYDPDSMRWSPNPEYQTDQQMRNDAVEQVFNYRKTQLTVDPTVLQEETDRQLQDIQEHQATSLYITDENGFAIENPNYDHRRNPGETDEEFAHRMAIRNLGYSDVPIPDLEEFIISETSLTDDRNFNAEGFAHFIATNISNEEVLGHFNTGLPAGLRPTDRPTSSPRSAEDIYEDLQEENSQVPEYLIDYGGRTTRNPDYRTDDELWEEATAEAAGWTHGMGQGGQHHAGPRTVKMSTEQDGMYDVPAVLLDDPDPQGLINYAENVYENGGPDFRPAAQKYAESVHERSLRQGAQEAYENSQTNRNLRNILLNNNSGLTAIDVLDKTLDEERTEMDVNNPQNNQERRIAAVVKRLDAGGGSHPLSRREQDIVIEIYNEKYPEFKIPLGTNLYNDLTDHVVTRRRNFDPDLFEQFYDKKQTETPEELNAEIETVNRETSRLENLVNQQNEDARIERIQQNYRDTVNTPTRRAIRDAMDERLYERRSKGGNPSRTADEQRIVDATYDTVMTETDVTTYSSVMFEKILIEEEAYYQGLENGLTPQEVGLNAHFAFAQHRHNVASSNSNSASVFPATVVQDQTPEQRRESSQRTLEIMLRKSQEARGWLRNSQIPTEQLRMQVELQNYKNAGPDEARRIMLTVNAFVRENRENKL